MPNKLYPGQSRIETPEEAGHSPVREETATEWWKGLNSFEKNTEEARTGLRNAAAKAATPKPEAEKEWKTVGTFPQSPVIGESGIKTPDEIRRGDEMTPEEKEAQQETADRLKKDYEKFKGQYDNDRVNMVADGGGHPDNNGVPWSDGKRAAAHGELDKLREGGENWQLTSEEPNHELIFINLDTGERESSIVEGGELYDYEGLGDTAQDWL